MTNKTHTTLYVGVSSGLQNRVYEHKNGLYEGSFTHRYKVHKLVYYKFFETIVGAITEEKRLKGGSRAQKIKLIEEQNPQWNDLYDGIL